MVSFRSQLFLRVLFVAPRFIFCWRIKTLLAEMSFNNALKNVPNEHKSSAIVICTHQKHDFVRISAPMSHNYIIKFAQKHHESGFASGELKRAERFCRLWTKHWHRPEHMAKFHRSVPKLGHIFGYGSEEIISCISPLILANMYLTLHVIS